MVARPDVSSIRGDREERRYGERSMRTIDVQTLSLYMALVSETLSRPEQQNTLKLLDESAPQSDRRVRLGVVAC